MFINGRQAEGCNLCLFEKREKSFRDDVLFTLSTEKSYTQEMLVTCKFLSLKCGQVYLFPAAFLVRALLVGSVRSLSPTTAPAIYSNKGLHEQRAVTLRRSSQATTLQTISHGCYVLSNS